MNFNNSGWLARYLDYRRSNPFADQLPSAGVKVLEEEGLHHELDEAIYYFLQPTGLLYGFPVGVPFPEQEYPGAAYMGTTERVHLIFLESLFACLVADRHFLLAGLTDERDHLMPALRLTAEFFTHPAARRSRRGVNPLRWLALPRRRDVFDRLEASLRERVGMGTEFLRLPGHYYNSFLFLDLYYAMVWQRRMLVEPEAAEQHMRDLVAQQATQRELLIRLMIAAAAISGGIVRAEKRLIEWFIRSSGLPPARVAALRSAMGEKQSLRGLNIPDMPWLVRRFMLESVLMTMLVDRVLSPDEEVFLLDVVEVLELWTEELSQSKMALEVFILHNESRLQIFRDRPMLLNVSANLREQAAMAVRKNLHRVVQEVRETQELYSLLMKSTHTALTREEKSKVRHQLLDILKTIPTLAIFALPGGGLILPVLIRLLPFNLLPSSFEEE
jgi:LETM1-like, RBD